MKKIEESEDDYAYTYSYLNCLHSSKLIKTYLKYSNSSLNFSKAIGGYL